MKFVLIALVLTVSCNGSVDYDGEYKKITEKLKNSMLKMYVISHNNITYDNKYDSINSISIQIAYCDCINNTISEQINLLCNETKNNFQTFQTICNEYEKYDYYNKNIDKLKSGEVIFLLCFVGSIFGFIFLILTLKHSILYIRNKKRIQYSLPEHVIETKTYSELV